VLQGAEHVRKLEEVPYVEGVGNKSASRRILIRCGSKRLPPAHPPLLTCPGGFLCPPAPKPPSVATGGYHYCFGTDGTASSNPLSSSSQSVSAVNPEAVNEKPRALAAVCGWLGT
jgi:hypothetical protein